MNKCLICNREIELNEYIVVISKKKHKYICSNCAIDNWHYYSIMTHNDEDDSEPDEDLDYCDYMEYCDEVWEQEYGPEVPNNAICTICHQPIDDTDEALIFNKQKLFYHYCCPYWPNKYSGCGTYFDNFSAFIDCKNNQKEIDNLIFDGLAEPFKLKDVI